MSRSRSAQVRDPDYLGHIERKRKAAREYQYKKKVRLMTTERQKKRLEEELAKAREALRRLKEEKEELQEKLKHEEDKSESFFKMWEEEWWKTHN